MFRNHQAAPEENKMSNQVKCVVVLYALFFVVVLAFAVSAEMKKHPYSEYQARLATEQTSVQPVDFNVSMSTAGYIALGVVAFVVLVLIWRFATAHPITFFVALLALLVVGGLFYYTSFNRGGERQNLTMIQPSGVDYRVDAQYSEINKTNSTTNVITAGSFGLYVLVILVVAIALSRIVKSFS